MIISDLAPPKNSDSYVGDYMVPFKLPPSQDDETTGTTLDYSDSILANLAKNNNWFEQSDSDSDSSSTGSSSSECEDNSDDGDIVFDNNSSEEGITNPSSNNNEKKKSTFSIDPPSTPFWFGYEDKGMLLFL